MNKLRTEVRMQLGSFIRDKRHERGMTLASLSRQTGIAEANLSLIETGKTDPRWSTIERILGALGLSGEQLVIDESASDPWQRLRRKAERGEDVRDEAWALAANTTRRSKAS